MLLAASSLPPQKGPSKNDVFSISSDSWGQTAPFLPSKTRCPPAPLTFATSSPRSKNFQFEKDDVDKWENDVAELRFKGIRDNLLGEGRHSQVYVGGYTSVSGAGRAGKGWKLCAVKRNFQDEDSIASSVNEVKILRRLSRSQDGKRGVMRFLGVWEEREDGGVKPWGREGTTDAGNLLIILPLYPLGTLQAFRENHPKFLNRHWFRSFALDLVFAVRYIHSLHILHADIKSGNVMVDNSLHLVLSDFSLSLHLPPSHPPLLDPLGLGTLEYSPPELVHPAPFPVTLASDVFSLGVTIGCLLFQREPYTSVRIRTEKVLRVSRGEYWDFHERKRIMFEEDSGSSCYSPPLRSTDGKSLSRNGSVKSYSAFSPVLSSEGDVDFGGEEAARIRRVLSARRLEKDLGLPPSVPPCGNSSDNPGRMRPTTCQHPHFCLVDGVKGEEEEELCEEAHGVTYKDGSPLAWFPAGDAIPGWARKLVWKCTREKAEERWDAGEALEFLEKQR